MIQLGIVGAGYWGPNIIRNFVNNPHCRVVMVCDREPQKLQHIQQLYGNRFTLTTCYEDLLCSEEIDAIAIITELSSHGSLAEAALLHDKHVFVEKPLASSSQECIFLGQLAAAKHKVLMVGHTYIYNPALLQLKRYVDSQQLGEIYYLHAQRLNLGIIHPHTSTLWDLAAHDLSMTLYLFDELPHTVSAWGQAFIVPDREDVVFMKLNFPSGKLAHIHTSRLDPEKRRQLTLVGSKKMAVFDDVSLDRKITLYDKTVDKQANRPLLTHAEYEDFSGFHYLTHSGDMTIPCFQFTEPLKLECQHFLDCINQASVQPLTGWLEGYQVVRILEAAQASLEQSGQPIEMDWKPVHNTVMPVLA